MPEVTFYLVVCTLLKALGVLVKVQARAHHTTTITTHELNFRYFSVLLSKRKLRTHLDDTHSCQWPATSIQFQMVIYRCQIRKINFTIHGHILYPVSSRFCPFTSFISRLKRCRYHDNNEEGDKEEEEEVEKGHKLKQNRISLRSELNQHIY